MTAPRAGSVICVLAAAAMAYFGATLGASLWRSRALTAASVAFEITPQDPAHRLLVVGDSTAVGTGAGAPESSVAGRLASAFPALRIDNRAVDGARTADVLQQLQREPLTHFDAILIQTGGNDILRLTDLSRLRRVTRELFDAAHARSAHVVMMSTGDVDPGADNPFRREPQKYYARDGLHPSAAGYGAWFDRLMANSSISDVFVAVAR